MQSERCVSVISLAFLLGGVSLASAQNAYTRINLVCDPSYYQEQGYTSQTQPYLIQDGNLLDAWGIALAPGGSRVWIANAVSGDSEEFIGGVNGAPLQQSGLSSVSLVPPGFIDHSEPFVTGVVDNSTAGLAGQPAEFPVYNSSGNTNGTTLLGYAKWIFCTEDGCLNGWVSTSATPTAPWVINYSKTAPFVPYQTNPVYTGVAMTQNAHTSAAFIHNGAGGTGNLVFAADNRNTVNNVGVIEVFNNAWQDVTTSFTFQTPASVGGLHPFNIMDIAGHLYVTYAAFDPAGDEGQEQLGGPGLGHLVEYNEDGSLVMDFHDGANTPAGVLNQPWGVAIAPSNFGAFSGDVLVANFGDGTISAFDPKSGNFLGDLQDSNGNTISIDGIWGLIFGNGSFGDANSLFFTSGPNSEYNGLVGKLTVSPSAMDTPTMPREELAFLALLLLFTAAGCVPRSKQNPAAS